MLSSSCDANPVASRRDDSLRRAIILPLVLLFVAFAPSAATQEPFEVAVLDSNGANPSTNATVIFSKFDGSDPQRFETDQQGVAEVDVPPGDYRVRAFVPNETGEQWFEDQMSVDPANGSLDLVRNLPNLIRRPELLGAESAPDGSAAYVPIGTPLELRIAIRSPAESPKEIAARAILTKGNVTIQDGLIGIATITAAGWINGTLAASTTPPYHANESLSTLRITLYQNGTTTIFDNAPPVTVFFRDGCLGDAVQLRVTLETTSVPFCAAADQAATWQAWAVEANQLINVRNTWAKRFATNQTTWSFPDSEAAWNTYSTETAALRTNVLRPLTTAQTDGSAYPTWQQLDSLRSLVDRNHTTIEEQWENAASTEHQERQAAAQIARVQTFGLIIGAAILGAAATIGGVTLIIRAWKRRAEYWIGYSSREQPASPLWLTLAVSGGLALLGLLLTFFSPLWSVLRGGA